MSKRKLPVLERAPRKPVELIQGSKVVRFVGVSLGGGKSDKACVAILEYYPENKKIFLSRLFEKIKSDEKISGDSKIHALIDQNNVDIAYVAFDTPWNLPACVTCQKVCPGAEVCKDPHIDWMWKHHNEKVSKKRPKKLFTPYTQRTIEMYLQTELEQPFHMHHAMGANSAPLLARASFLKKRLTAVDCIEVFPKLTLWRLGKSLNMMESQLTDHRAAFGGDESRAQFLQTLNDNDIAFIYTQDMKHMVENNHAFEAFLCGFTAFLKYKGLTEKKPKNFPKNEDWIEFPTQDLKLKDL
ncbi:MAG: DUF429 domain-containing protein [Bdellovibrionaceae bacterium]|nr:DUF429 domain-containing protein [Bdellovibrio sp.]